MFWNRLSLAPIRDEDNRLTHYLGLMYDVTERRRAEAELAYAVSHDTTTGLPRYEIVRDSLCQRLTMSPWDPVSVLFVDLDHFYGINESLGPAYGDALLQKVAARIRKEAGSEARIARISGDTFIVVLPRCIVEHAIDIGKNICSAIHSSFEHEGAVATVTASIGVASYPLHCFEPLELIRRAEVAMNHAKQEGGDTAQVFEPDRVQEIEDRRLLGRQLRSAIANGQLVLHYEPRLSGDLRRVTGFEALARWPHAQLGWIAPQRFIPVLETLGLMPEFGRWAISEATHQLRRWHDAGARDLCVCVNVSRAQLLRPGLVEHVRQALRSSGVKPSLLELEFSMLPSDSGRERACATLTELHEVGVRLSLDEFSGVGTVLAFPRLFSGLKIGRTIIGTVPGNAQHVAVAQALTGIGRALHMQITAEGIETAEQRDFAVQLGCERLQGHLFSNAIPAAEVLAWLAQRAAA